jgi:transcriptional regulator with XRE-family HTH domain
MNQAVLDTSEEAIARRLRDGMDAARVTNSQLAEASGISVQGVGDWLRTGKISRDRLPAISKAIKRSIDWLLTGESPIDDVIDALPPSDQQQVFDFILYKVEKAPTPYISQELAKDYVEMIERPKKDMQKRKGET